MPTYMKMSIFLFGVIPALAQIPTAANSKIGLFLSAASASTQPATKKVVMDGRTPAFVELTNGTTAEMTVNCSPVGYSKKPTQPIAPESPSGNEWSVLVVYEPLDNRDLIDAGAGGLEPFASVELAPGESRIIALPLLTNWLKGSTRVTVEVFNSSTVVSSNSITIDASR